MLRSRKGSSTWELLAGIVLTEAGVALLGLAGLDSLRLPVQLLFYAGGFLACASGMFLVWNDPFRALPRDDVLAGAPVKRKEAFLGKIILNGYILEAYEEDAGSDGRRFRLRSFPSMGPEREAGFIRYLVHEGFIEKRWPRLSRKIKEEAGWAFFL